MIKTKKSLKLLRRNLYGAILLGLLLPFFFRVVVQEEVETIASVSIVMILLSAINLQYLRRIESAVQEECPSSKANEA
ncbi:MULTISPECIES: hypothetical protein [unclassified Lentimonas]|uniref:hypothetical protein n=1 Tax=unclassified Lentimonas TaxID=2630993 RepID=UPI00132992BF|nr:MULTISPECIES: hypothetical protein [unclassified Lentimonas]CAA6691480.1 Unannotated [Lentimonas sp. CC10]CAA6693806.1 Unannotated [Lentimonas sp. CC19]CAA7070936.1 Unannotated [Lentimonas sp. CC11]